MGCRPWMISFYVVILFICVFIYEFKVGFIEIVKLMLVGNDLINKVVITQFWILQNFLICYFIFI